MPFQKGYIPWSKGLNKETDERVKSLSEKLKGRTAWNKGLKGVLHHSRETRNKMKGRLAWNKGLTKETDGRVPHYPSWNKGLTKETDERVRRMIENRVVWCKGLTKETDERVRKRGEKLKGENAPHWKGGIGKKPYPFDFNKELKELIRKRDGYVCQLCHMPQRELLCKLDVHHIDYVKENLDPRNLTSLCRSCNSKVNINRGYWTKYFRVRVIEI